MEPRLSLRDLSHEQILKLQADHEGSIIFPNVSPKDLGGWKKKHPQVIESTKIRHEYNFLTGSLVIKCMPMATHDSLQTFFNGTVLLSLSEKFGMSQTLSLVTVGSGTSDWTGSSEKLPDAYVKLPGAEFPSVVCEAGWAEGHEELMNDARLWLLHTDGQTRIVLVVSFTENTLKHSLQAANEEPEEEVRPHGSTSEEETVVDSIDGATNLNDLANNLMDLNRRDKLRQPLVGNLSATLHVYRANEDGRDIVQSFEATLLPQPVVDGGGPKEFGITMEELLGDSVPEGQDPGDRIMFCLENLRDFIRRSIPDTERVRATRRAKKLLRMAGVWEEEETFAQSKRRCRNPPGA
ncbi:hypothetical protein L873DRAFT_418813 [Choiromyces venosus 120613-1]|uniref:Uncharacterized protein n=1 Tax=Choiromyces venosus 120613-1 TaxID=1336337 RepID=A0A3N4JW58_9PEZI|nr:hypothetical protein L873DRAFT_418813 [Choiromyces venosus 120613-1]